MFAPDRMTAVRRRPLFNGAAEALPRPPRRRPFGDEAFFANDTARSHLRS